METDRLLLPSKDIQRIVEQLWVLVRRTADTLAEQQNEDLEARTRVVYLESELESMAATVQSQNAAIEHLKEEVQQKDSLQIEVRELSAVNSDLQRKVEELQTQLNAAQQLADSRLETQQSHQELEAELTAVTVRAQNMEQVLQERGRDLSEANVLVEQLRSELNNVRAAHESVAGEAQTAISDYEKRIAELLASDAAKMQELERMHQEHHSSLLEAEVKAMAIAEAKAEAALAQKYAEDSSAAKYASLVDEMSVTIAELEQKLQVAESRLQEYDEMKKKSSKAPTLIEGMLRSDVESLSARVAQLEEERAHWSHEDSENSSDTDREAEHEERNQRNALLAGMAEKLRTAIEILERSTKAG